MTKHAKKSNPLQAVDLPKTMAVGIPLPLLSDPQASQYPGTYSRTSSREREGGAEGSLGRALANHCRARELDPEPGVHRADR